MLYTSVFVCVVLCALEAANTTDMENFCGTARWIQMGEDDMSMRERKTGQIMVHLVFQLKCVKAIRSTVCFQQKARVQIPVSISTSKSFPHTAVMFFDITLV